MLSSSLANSSFSETIEKSSLFLSFSSSFNLIISLLQVSLLYFMRSEACLYSNGINPFLEVLQQFHNVEFHNGITMEYIDKSSNHILDTGMAHDLAVVCSAHV